MTNRDNIINSHQEKGFTIIEVVLVLAVAGLIFLVVFLALPALQKSQRDGERRQDTSRIISGISYRKANGTPLNQQVGGFYLSPNYLGVVTTQISLIYQRSYTWSPCNEPRAAYSPSLTMKRAIIAFGCTCDERTVDKMPVASVGWGNVQAILENGSIYCQDF